MPMRYITVLILLAMAVSVNTGRAWSQEDTGSSGAAVVMVEVDGSLPCQGIQAAIDALGPEGGTVILPEGTFALMRTLMLPHHVTLQGQGPDKTILTSQRTDTWVAITGGEGLRYELERIPEDLRVGTSIYIWPRGRGQAGWLGHYVPQVVTAIEGNTITVDGEMINPRPGPHAGVISYGLVSRLRTPVVRGAIELEVHDSSIFVVGGAVAVGSADSNGNESLSFIREIRGDTLVLERPIRMDHPFEDGGMWRRPGVWTLFPLISAESARNITIRDLALVSPIPPDQRPKMDRYTLSLIHLFDVRDSLIENVHASNSFTDGISLQGGKNLTVRRCVARDNAGNGFHPGTGLVDSLFEENVAEDNHWAGLYFCWHNRRHILRHNRFVRNGRGGVTGLGHPGEYDNIIEENYIAENGGPGININGGPQGNIVRNNIIENNSQSEPGRHPGIALFASHADARHYTISGNTIRDTQESPTQFIGIEEKHGMRGDRKTNTADENTIRGNRFAGHREADIVIVGASTRAEENAGATIRRDAAPADAPPR